MMTAAGVLQPEVCVVISRHIDRTAKNRKEVQKGSRGAVRVLLNTYLMGERQKQIKIAFIKKLGAD